MAHAVPGESNNSVIPYSNDLGNSCIFLSNWLAYIAKSQNVSRLTKLSLIRAITTRQIPVPRSMERISSDVNKDLGLKAQAKAKDLDPKAKAKAQGLVSQGPGPGQGRETQGQGQGQKLETSR